MTNNAPFALCQKEKEQYLFSKLHKLTSFHRDNCPEYRKMLDALNYNVNTITCNDDLPFFPVSLFKTLKLSSIADEDVFKVLTSSGTTGQAVSKMYLDKNTAAAQQKVLMSIVNEFMGGTRMPMLIIDCPSVLKDRKSFSARGAGILGFSIFGAHRTYALNDDMSLNLEAVTEFLTRFKGQRILLFGFTFIIWLHFYQELVKVPQKLDLSSAILFHGGGWKKIQEQAVSPKVFREKFAEICGLTDIHSYYGMVEQTGSIYVECNEGHLHASKFSDIIIRNPLTLEPCAVGEKGVVQVLSELPASYPGHSLLTEDEGILLGEDDCSCGRKGRYFHILGRLKNAEIRGCSDTYEQRK